MEQGLNKLHWKQLDQKVKNEKSEKQKKPASAVGKGWIEQRMKFADNLGIRWGSAPSAELAQNPWFALLTEREADVLRQHRLWRGSGIYLNRSIGLAL